MKIFSILVTELNQIWIVYHENGVTYWSDMFRTYAISNKGEFNGQC